MTKSLERTNIPYIYPIFVDINTRNITWRIPYDKITPKYLKYELEILFYNKEDEDDVSWDDMKEFYSDSLITCRSNVINVDCEPVDEGRLVNSIKVRGFYSFSELSSESSVYGVMIYGEAIYGGSIENLYDSYKIRIKYLYDISTNDLPFDIKSSGWTYSRRHPKYIQRVSGFLENMLQALEVNHFYDLSGESTITKLEKSYAREFNDFAIELFKMGLSNSSETSSNDDFLRSFAPLSKIPRSSYINFIEWRDIAKEVIKAFKYQCSKYSIERFFELLYGTKTKTGLLSDFSWVLDVIGPPEEIYRGLDVLRPSSETEYDPLILRKKQEAGFTANISVKNPYSLPVISELDQNAIETSLLAALNKKIEYPDMYEKEEHQMAFEPGPMSFDGNSIWVSSNNNVYLLDENFDISGYVPIESPSTITKLQLTDKSMFVFSDVTTAKIDLDTKEVVSYSTPSMNVITSEYDGTNIVMNNNSVTEIRDPETFLATSTIPGYIHGDFISMSGIKTTVPGYGDIDGKYIVATEPLTNKIAFIDSSYAVVTRINTIESVPEFILFINGYYYVSCQDKVIKIDSSDTDTQTTTVNLSGKDIIDMKFDGKDIFIATSSNTVEIYDIDFNKIQTMENIEMDQSVITRTGIIYANESGKKITKLKDY